MMIKHGDDEITSSSSLDFYFCEYSSPPFKDSSHLHHFAGDSDLTINLFLDNLDLHIPEPFFYELLTLLATFVYLSLESTAGTSLTPAARAMEARHAIGTR